MTPNVNLRELQEVVPAGVELEIRIPGKGSPGVFDSQVTIILQQGPRRITRLTSLMLVENASGQDLIGFIQEMVADLQGHV